MLEDGRVAWPEGRAGAHAERLPLRWRGRAIGELVVDRDTPFTDDDRQLLDAIANQAAVALEHGRMALRGVLAQEIHHRVKNNLQTVASLLRLQARAEGVDPAKALGDSVNRILAIAAVHEVLTEHREDVVELAELVDRLRAMLVQGLVAEKEVSAELAPVELAGQRATALALVFSELLSNALEHGGGHISITLRRTGTTAFSASSTTARACRPRPTEPASPSSVRSCATSSAGRSTSRTTTACVRRCGFPAWSGRTTDAHSDRRRRDHHPTRPARAARAAGFEVVAEARDGEEAVALARSSRARACASST